MHPTLFLLSFRLPQPGSNFVQYKFRNIMDLSDITRLISSLRAQTARDSITPNGLGSILQRIVDAISSMSGIDVEDEAAILQRLSAAESNASTALQAAQNAQAGAAGNVIDSFTQSQDEDEVSLSIKQHGHSARQVVLPAASSTGAGIMTATDKSHLDTAYGKRVNLMSAPSSESVVTLTITFGDGTTKSVTFVGATAGTGGKAGLMTKEQADQLAALVAAGPAESVRDDAGYLKQQYAAPIILRNVTDTVFDDLAIGDVYYDTSHLFYHTEDQSGDPDIGAPSRKVIYYCLADQTLYRWTGSRFVQAVSISSGDVTVPTKLSDLINDMGFLTAHQPLKTINGQTITGTGNITIDGAAELKDASNHIKQNSATPVVLRNVADTLLDDLNEGDVYFDSGHLFWHTESSSGDIDLGTPSKRLVYFCLGNSNFYRWGGSSFTKINMPAGTTPHIDPTTGNWFIGTTNTGVHAQGPMGNTQLLNPSTFDPETQIINNLTTGGEGDALSAEMGKELNDRLIEICGGIAYEDVETVVEHTEDVTMTTGKYIPANQGVGQVCPMTMSNSTVNDCAIVNLQAGQKLEIKGVGGNSSRLWAILDKNTHVIQSVADANTDNSVTGIPIITKTIVAETDCIVVVNVYNVNGNPPYGNDSNTPYSVKLTTYTTEIVPAGTPVDGILGGMQESIEDNTERIAALESATDGALTGDKALEMTTTMPSTAAAFHALWDKFVTDGWAARTTIASPNSKPVYLYHIDPYNKIVKNPNNTAAFTVADNDYFQKKKILITSGIHGDEKQTPLWLYEFFNRILYNDEFAAMRSAFDFYVVPLVNPTGYDANTRNNYNNVNINRDFKRQTQVETQAVCDLIDDGSFDMYLDSHQLSGGSGKSNISPAVCAALICSSTATDDTLRNLCTMFSRGGARADIALNAHFNKTVAQSCFVWPPITVTGDDMQSHEYGAWKGIADSFEFEFTQYAYQFSGSDVIYNNGSMVYGNTVFHYLMMEFLG